VVQLGSRRIWRFRWHGTVKPCLCTRCTNISV
jgi:hypothetical protein